MSVLEGAGQVSLLMFMLLSLSDLHCQFHDFLLDLPCVRTTHKQLGLLLQGDRPQSKKTGSAWRAI